MKRTVLALFITVIVLSLLVIVQARVEVPKAIKQPMWSIWLAIDELQEMADELEARVASLEACACGNNTGECTPTGVEVCNGKDDDCNDVIDDIAAEDCDGDDEDLCKEGITQCVAGTLTCTDDTDDNLEVCDGIDNDCNGLTDEIDCEGACATDQDCPSEPANCQDAATCQGTRLDGMCEDGVCTTAEVPDDSACEGLLADTCGYYASIYCSAEEDQSPACLDGCATDEDCDENAHCEGTCEPDIEAGGSCDTQEQCAGALFCVDNTCCMSDCLDTCMACGSDGSCEDLPYGEDPDEECGDIDCSNHYYGWIGNDCYLRADAPAYEVGCNGAGACQDGDELCPMQDPGMVAVSCSEENPPDYDTCTDTIPGQCQA